MSSSSASPVAAVVSRHQKVDVPQREDALLDGLGGVSAQEHFYPGVFRQEHQGQVVHIVDVVALVRTEDGE